MSADVLTPRRAQLAAARAAVRSERCRACGGRGWEREGDSSPAGCTACGGNGECGPARRDGDGRADLTDAQAAWEALATRGVIPMEWASDARRVFDYSVEMSCLHCLGSGRAHWAYARPRTTSCSVCNGSGRRRSGTVLPHPPTVAAAVALASDVAGVLAAESLAREVTRHERVAWRVAPPAEAAAVRTRCEQWGAGMPGGIALGVRYALPDLYALGYALDAIRDDAVVLLCPALAESVA